MNNKKNFILQAILWVVQGALVGVGLHVPDLVHQLPPGEDLSGVGEELV